MARYPSMEKSSSWECVWTDCRAGSALSPHVWFLIVDVIALKIYFLWKTDNVQSFSHIFFEARPVKFSSA